MLVESTVTGAEAGGSLRARAAAYWNGALVAEARGEYRLAQRMLESALALHGEVGNAFAVAALRANTGTLYLRLPTPRLEEAASYLRQALEDLPSVGSRRASATGCSSSFRGGGQ
ncbi:MAG: tetratricopeptide repeat protein [Frankiaceae bacterium]